VRAFLRERLSRMHLSVLSDPNVVRDSPTQLILLFLCILLKIVGYVETVKIGSVIR